MTFFTLMVHTIIKFIIEVRVYIIQIKSNPKACKIVRTSNASREQKNLRPEE